MLYKDSLLTFSSLSNETKKTSGWQWDLTKIQKMDITDNVVTLMTQKVENLSAKAQHILKLAACIGNQFDLQTLTIINEKSLKETAKELWEVIEEGLIEVFEGYQLVLTGEISPHSVNCKFLHDQIQQVAYSLITKANKTKLHLKIGRLMLANKPEMKHDETIFDLVNHLNIASDLINQMEERFELAQLNLNAGKKAKASMAYKLALQYFIMGIKHLSPATEGEKNKETAYLTVEKERAWQTHYALSMALYLETAEVAYLTNDFEQAETLIKLVLQQAKTMFDRVKIYEIRSQAYVFQDETSKALNVALDALNLLNISFPRKPNMGHIIIKLLQTKFALRKKTDG